MGLLTVVFINGASEITANLSLSFIAISFLAGLVYSGEALLKRLPRIVMSVSLLLGIASVVAAAFFITQYYFQPISQIYGSVTENLLIFLQIIICSFVISSANLFLLFISSNYSRMGSLIGIFSVYFWALSFFFIEFSSEIQTTWGSMLLLAIASTFFPTASWATSIVISASTNLVEADMNQHQISVLWTLIGVAPPVIAATIMASYAWSWLPALGIEYREFQISVAAAFLLIIVVIALGTYVGWRASRRDPKAAAFREIALAFITRGGTNFQEADLTGGNFSGAILKNANFRQANLTGVSWFHSYKLEHACVSSSYLESPQVQQLVVTRIGQGQNWNHFDLEGINLQQANLADASFVKTNLKNANLRNADLSRAQLIGTNLDQADLFGACLTGAYIKDIQITDTTRLKGVDCQYFYRRRPTKENPDPARYPEDHRQILRPGELAQFLRRTQTASP